MISHAVWMNNTKRSVHRRGASLEKVDNALLAYERAASQGDEEQFRQYVILSHALQDWKKGVNNWEEHPRNHSGAITELSDSLHDIALTALEAERDSALQNLFLGKQMVTAATAAKILKASVDQILNVDQAAGAFKKPYAPPPKTGAEFGKQLATAKYGNLSSIHDPGPLVKALFGLAPDGVEGAAAVGKELATTLGNGIFSKVAGYVPILGAIISVKDLCGEWYKISVSRQQQKQSARARGAVRPGDPLEALRAIDQLLKREADEHSRRRNMHGAAFTAKLIIPASTPIADGLNGLGQVCETIYQAGVDYKEKNSANEFLKKGAIDISVFQKAPVLGAYYMACSTRSTVLNFLMREIGARDWMSRIEELNKCVDPVIASSRRLVSVSRYQIPGMPLMVAPGSQKKKKEKSEQEKNFDQIFKYEKAGRLKKLFMRRPVPISTYSQNQG